MCIRRGTNNSTNINIISKHISFLLHQFIKQCAVNFMFFVFLGLSRAVHSDWLPTALPILDVLRVQCVPPSQRKWQRLEPPGSILRLPVHHHLLWLPS